MFNGVYVKDILIPLPDDPGLVERIAERRVQAPALAIEKYDFRWPEYFETFKARLLKVWQRREGGEDGQGSGLIIVAVEHIGSTSVPGLPAKAVIDIDLILSDNTRSAESVYVPLLEEAGFQFLLREPAWYEHRFFVASEPIACNLHVFGPQCAMAERHRVFRDWLRVHENDKELYARVKRECAAMSNEKGEGVREYTKRKDEVVQHIMERAVSGLKQRNPRDAS